MFFPFLQKVAPTFWWLDAASIKKVSDTFCTFWWLRCVICDTQIYHSFIYLKHLALIASQLSILFTLN